MRELRARLRWWRIILILALLGLAVYLTCSFIYDYSIAWWFFPAMVVILVVNVVFGWRDERRRDREAKRNL